MNRLTAIIIAAALVVGAVVVRSRIDRHHSEATTTLRLTCSTELEAACDEMHRRDPRIAVTVESPGATMARVGPLGHGVDTGFDGWLTLGPWPQMSTELAAFGRVRPEGLLLGAPLGLAIRADRAALLTRQCGGQVTWSCVRDALAKVRWDGLPGGAGLGGEIRLGLPNPAAEAEGLLTLDAAAEAHQPDLSATDLSSDQFLEWFGALTNAVDVSADPLASLVATHINPDIAATARPIAEAALAGAALKPVLTYPSPVAIGELYYAGESTPAGELLRNLVRGPVGRGVLTRRGWDPVSEKVHRPDPGLLLSVRDLWKRSHS